MSLLLLVSCSSKRRNFNLEYQYPQWYTHAPVSVDKFYGTGKGVGKTAAINDALNSIAKQIQVIVSSKFEETVQSKNGFNDSYIRETISASVIGVELSGYKIVQSIQTENYDTLVLIELDKKLVTQNYKDKLKIIKEEINQSLMSDDLTFLKKKSNNLKKISQIEGIVAVLRSIEEKEPSIYLSNEDENEKFNKRLSGISFKIIANTESSVAIEKIIKHELTTAGYKVVSSDGPSSFIISINDSVLTQSQGNRFFVRHSVEIKATRPNGEVFATKNTEEVLSSYVSFKDALANTGYEFKKYFKSNSIDQFLNLSL